VVPLYQLLKTPEKGGDEQQTKPESYWPLSLLIASVPKGTAWLDDGE
jgi:hypothetical protein